jgi:hypothetical protein
MTMIFMVGLSLWVGWFERRRRAGAGRQPAGLRDRVGEAVGAEHDGAGLRAGFQAEHEVGWMTDMSPGPRS